jgi:hypothetical protein
MSDKDQPLDEPSLTLRQALREQADADFAEMEDALAQVCKMSEDERRRELIAYGFLPDEPAAGPAAAPDSSLLTRLRRWFDAPSHRLMLGAGVAACLAASIGLVMVLERPGVSDDAGPAYRSGDGRQVVKTKDPAGSAEAFAKELKSLSVSPKLSVFGDIATLELAWPDKPTEAQLTWLRKHGLRAKPGETITVEIRRGGS